MRRGAGGQLGKADPWGANARPLIGGQAKAVDSKPNRGAKVAQAASARQQSQSSNSAQSPLKSGEKTSLVASSSTSAVSTLNEASLWSTLPSDVIQNHIVPSLMKFQYISNFRRVCRHWALSSWLPRVLLRSEEGGCVAANFIARTALVRLPSGFLCMEDLLNKAPFLDSLVIHPTQSTGLFHHEAPHWPHFTRLIRQKHSLTSLVIENVFLTEQSLDLLAESIGAPSCCLSSLTLSCRAGIPVEHPERFFSAISKAPRLTSLDIFISNEWNTSWLEHLSVVLQSPACILSHLNLRNRTEFSSCTALADALMVNTSLRCFAIDAGRLDGSVLIRSLKAHPKLLELKFTAMETPDLESMSEFLAENNSVTLLDRSGSIRFGRQDTPHQWAQFGEALGKNRSIQVLRGFSHAFPYHLELFARQTTLREFDFEDSWFGFNQEESLGKVISSHAPNLDALSLGRVEGFSSQTQWGIVEGLRKCHRLRWFKLSGLDYVGSKKATPKQIKCYVSALRSLKHLRHLILHRIPLTRCVGEIAQYITKYNCIEHLSLRTAELTTADAVTIFAAIAQVPGRLQHLDISDNPIQGAPELTAALSGALDATLSSLETFLLNDVPIDAGSLNALILHLESKSHLIGVVGLQRINMANVVKQRLGRLKLARRDITLDASEVKYPSPFARQ